MKERKVKLFILNSKFMGVAEFERFGKRRFQSIHLKIGPESIEELIIIGSILL
jgi:hypothetical protein